MKAPFAATCTAGVNLGGARTVRLGDAARGVDITVVPASHDSTVSRALLSEPQRRMLEPDNTGVQLGQPSGYVIRFSNGLTVYLSGDTGIHTEMKTVVADYHKANLMLLNLGLSAMDAVPAAHVTNELVRPNAVIVTHVNEAATQGGKLLPQSRTATYVGLVKNRPVHLALSGRTMEFDGSGKCVAGCN
jgi:L-ascorbate metabolism protein UlaG (beta-lactamase superfamily)